MMNTLRSATEPDPMDGENNYFMPQCMDRMHTVSMSTEEEGLSHQQSQQQQQQQQHVSNPARSTSNSAAVAAVTHKRCELPDSGEFRSIFRGMALERAPGFLKDLGESLLHSSQKSGVHE